MATFTLGDSFMLSDTKGEVVRQLHQGLRFLSDRCIREGLLLAELTGEQVRGVICLFL